MSAPWFGNPVENRPADSSSLILSIENWHANKISFSFSTSISFSLKSAVVAWGHLIPPRLVKMKQCWQLTQVVELLGQIIPLHLQMTLLELWQLLLVPLERAVSVLFLVLSSYIEIVLPYIIMQILIIFLKKIILYDYIFKIQFTDIV